MKIRECLRLFIPPIYYKVKKRIYPSKNLFEFVFPMKLSKEKTLLKQGQLPHIKHNSNKIIIIGNGPSLNLSVALYKNEILKNDRICVNYFASSDFYEVLQPNIYVFADPAFFRVPDNQVNSIRVLFDNLVNKTTWSMTIFIPSGAKDAPTLEWLRMNQNIKIEFYNSEDQNVGKMSKFEAWDKNLIAPPAQNVLNVSLYLALFWGYPETFLIGADSSFLEDIRVDQETNELFSIDSHFYKQKQVYFDTKLFDAKRGRVRSDWKLHELIHAYARMFEYYADLKEYADYKGLKVYNASEYSWINCFERKKL